jgi:hypothetical protein
MNVIETALGRIVPANEAQTVLEDAVLSLLHGYRMSPQNPKNAPMKLSEIARGVSSDPVLVEAALEALMERTPPLVKEREAFQQERTFSITGSGVGFVRNMPQGLDSLA